MKILVTGGAGFIGSNIVDAYIGKGHEVFVVDDLSSGSLDNLSPKAKFFQVDIRDPQLGKILQENKFDVVNHLAAQMDVRRSVADPIFDAGVNIVGTLNLLENCLKSGVKKIIFSSTGGAIYGEQDYFPADENHPTRPLSPYGIAKLSVEKYLFYYYAVHGLKCVVLRYANVYGPRQNPHGEAGVVAIFTSKLLKGEEPIINGDGKQTRDYTYVGDVVQANVLALDYDKQDVFNIGTGKETDVNALFNTLIAATGSSAKESHGPAKAGEQMRSVIDYSKAKTLLGWEPKVGLDEGLKLTVEFFRKRIAG
ncbi:MAG: SDR family oxidoreductase [Bacteroidetes bacterium]|nr:SDR family oxidoreductase [Bacteroidota bacterium]MCL5738944.1 SDR family oxidoreductase [Bacteroidota bacterium]